MERDDKGKKGCATNREQNWEPKKHIRKNTSIKCSWDCPGILGGGGGISFMCFSSRQ